MDDDGVLTDDLLLLGVDWVTDAHTAGFDMDSGHNFTFFFWVWYSAGHFDLEMITNILKFSSCNDFCSNLFPYLPQLNLPF